MIRLLFLLPLLFGCSRSAYAQDARESTKIRIIHSSIGSQAKSWVLDRPEVRDTALLDVVYRFDYCYDPAQGSRRMSRMRLQVGSAWIKYYGISRELQDSLYTFDYRLAAKNTPFGSVPRVSVSDRTRALQEYAGDPNTNGEVWTWKMDGSRIVRYHHLEQHDAALTYGEPGERIRWELLPRTDSVCGYGCHTAMAEFRGRRWTVWYAPDIPVAYGPWKFAGLPGLVLQAEDAAGEFRWTCERIGTTAAPIVWYDTEESKELTRKQILRYFRNFYAAPFAQMRGSYTGNFRVVSADRKWLDESWTIPYNPIERE